MWRGVITYLEGCWMPFDVDVVNPATAMLRLVFIAILHLLLCYAAMNSLLLLLLRLQYLMLTELNELKSSILLILSILTAK